MGKKKRRVERLHLAISGGSSVGKKLGIIKEKRQKKTRELLNMKIFW